MTYEHVFSCTECAVVLFGEGLPLLLVALIFPHYGVELCIAEVKHKQYAYENKEL
jgi:hypothetical protein